MTQRETRHTHAHTYLSLPAAQANYKRSQTNNPYPSSRAPLCISAVNDIIVRLQCWVFTTAPNATAPASSNAAADSRWKNSGNQLLAEL